MKKSSSLPSGETLPDEEESYYGERAVGFLCVLMLSISTVLLVLYYLESQEVAAKINAMHRIREFMVSRNQSFEHMNDSAILNEAQKLLQEVVKIDSKIFELQLSIDAFIERISTGWKQHDGHLYYLDAYETAFFYARRACNNRNAILTPITTASEETFVESLSKASRQSVWIGLLKDDKSWKWIDGKTPFKTSFWEPGQPDSWSPLREDCVEIRMNCATPGNCWNNVSCDERKAAVCRVSPDERWMT
uniref:C-type lectin domain family 4 member K-like n=1 Tax=Podarcis muralis TaxID=64176 RepID=UPI0010A08ACC|nr:C-type lectin domain family 4 member K-like [Podarcis muralis]